jgi:long-chain acyl-CoA synthetase
MHGLVALVRERARLQPAAEALGHGARSLDYATFWLQVEGFAHALLAKGLVPGERVAVILPNRPEAAVALYAIWLAGGVAVPLNVQARERDFTAWIRHCGAQQVVYEQGHADVETMLETFPEALTTWDVAADMPLPIAAGGRFPPGTASVDALACILYTSGTTGAPKGVMLSHGNLASNVSAVIGYLGLTPQDRILSLLPCYYAYGASVLHTHLVAGASVVFAEPMLFPQQTLKALATSRATGFSGVPSTYALLCDHTDAGMFDFSALRYLTQAGGAMSPALTRQVRGLLPQAALYVMYGQTEATSRLTWLPPDRLMEKLGSVGIPVDGVDIRVADENGCTLPVGSEGEVLVRGQSVMLGYWQAPEASALALRDGWLRTRDIGWLDEDGFLWIAGRSDDLIKTGAHRVHPQDVEDVIAEVAGVRESAVVGIDDEMLGQAIAAYIVAEGSRPELERDIRAHCRKRMAPYKIPRTIHFIDTLPRTASGKVRRAALAQVHATP